MTTRIERKPAPDWAALDIPAFTDHQPEPTKRSSTVMAVPLSTVHPREVEYLWFPYLPKGKLTTLDGDPGIGKSWFTLAMAAHVSTGRNFPGDPAGMRRAPGTVLILNSEDDPADTTRPRLDILHGDVSKIFIASDFFTLDQKAGLAKLRGLILETGAQLVIIDPIQAWMGGKVDMNKANELRAVMGPIGHLAAETGCAIVIVRHVRKSSSSAPVSDKAIYRGLGSVDGIAAVRSGLYATKANDGTRTVQHIKANVAKEGPPIGFTVGEDFSWQILPEDWSSPLPARGGIKVSTTPRDVSPITQFLRAELALGPKLARDILAAAKEKNISPRNLQRAKDGLVRSYRETPTGPWLWALVQELHPAGADVPSDRSIAVGAPTYDPTSYTDPEDAALAAMLAQGEPHFGHES